MQNKAIVFINAGIFFFSDDYDMRPLIQGFYWLANRQHIVGGSDPHKINLQKSLKLIEDQSPCRQFHHPKPWTWPYNENFLWSYLDRKQT